jgi:sterol 14-demethylase
VFGDLGFFRERWDWWQRSVAQSTTGSFLYHIGQYTVVGVSGQEGRKFFFESKDLGFSEGYAVLFGQAPDYTGPEGEEGFSKWFSTRLVEMVKQPNLVKILPEILQDARRTIDTIATSEKDLCDPFTVIYKLVFLIHLRTVGCKEIADDQKQLERVLHLYEIIENSSTVTGIIFPWLLTPSKIKRMYAGGRLYMIFNSIANARKKLDKEVEDPLQSLLNKGDDMQKIIAVSPAVSFIYHRLTHSSL